MTNIKIDDVYKLKLEDIQYYDDILERAMPLSSFNYNEWKLFVDPEQYENNDIYVNSKKCGFYRELTNEEYEERVQKCKLDELSLCNEEIHTSINRKQRKCKNNYFTCSDHPHLISKITICICSGCSPATASEYEENNYVNIENNHCIYCQCLKCVCRCRSKLFYNSENIELLPYWDNPCWCWGTCKICRGECDKK